MKTKNQVAIIRGNYFWKIS